MIRFAFCLAVLVGAGAVAPVGGLWAPVAHAQDGGTPHRELTKSELKQYRAIMDRAVRAAKKGKHSEAIALYDQALAIRPNDAAALTDQGWSAFLMGALDRAESITRRAVAANGDNQRQAAGYYNLGRILQGRGDRAGAIAAYIKSLQLRPTRTARDQLATLDPAKASEMDPLKPLPMLGPFTRLEDVCRTPELKELTPCPEPGYGAQLSEVPRPYTDVVWLRAGNARCHVAFRLARGWFVDQRGDFCGDDAESDWTAGEFRVVDLVPGGNREVVFSTSTRNFDLIPNEQGAIHSYVRDCVGRMLVCGVPAETSPPTPARPPSCLYLPTGKGDDCVEGWQTMWKWELKPIFSNDGQLEVKGTGDLDRDTRLLVGKHRFVFP